MELNLLTRWASVGKELNALGVLEKELERLKRKRLKQQAQRFVRTVRAGIELYMMHAISSRLEKQVALASNAASSGSEDEPDEGKVAASQDAQTAAAVTVDTSSQAVCFMFVFLRPLVRVLPALAVS